MNFILRKHSVESRKGDYAVRTTEVTLFGVPIYRNNTMSTNSNAVRQLTVISDNKNSIKGFNNED
jgi:hypothetical protein